MGRDFPDLCKGIFERKGTFPVPAMLLEYLKRLYFLKRFLPYSDSFGVGKSGSDEHFLS